MTDERQTTREDALYPGISTFTELDDGTVLEGVMKDYSGGGAKIAGPATGLSIGDEITLVMVVHGGEKVACQCEVRYLDVAEESYGLLFKSPPQTIENTDTVKRCVRCERQYAAEWKFCGHCGYELRLV